MEKSKDRKKERSPDSLSLQNTIFINLKWYYFKRYGKNTIQFNEQKKWTCVIEK